MAFILRNSDDEFEQYRRRREAERARDEAGVVPEQDPGPAHGSRAVDAVPAGTGTVRQVGPVRKAIGSVFGLLALVSFVSVFAMAFLFMSSLEANGLTWLVIAAFGMMFFCAGIAIWSGGAGRLPLVFALVGGVILAVSLGYGLGGDGMRDMLMDRGLPMLGGVAFMSAGVGMLTVPNIVYKRRKARYTAVVTARVTDKWKETHRDADGHHHTSWHLAWAYSYNGQEYHYKSPVGRRPEDRDIGHIGQLYVDPMDPGRVWEGGDRFVAVMLGFMGAVFTVSGIAVIFLMSMR